MRRFSWRMFLFAGIFCAAHGAALAAGDALGPQLQSQAALVVDEQTGEVLYSKNVASVVPIASITKLMTAMVTLDARLALAEDIEITEDEVDATRGQRSRIKPGMIISRKDLLRLALMSSENRAAAALARTYPGGARAFVQAMNDKAAQIDMHDSRFVEPTGLSSQNVSNPNDLAHLVRTAHGYPLIREFTTSSSYELEVSGHRIGFLNTNGLVRSGTWDIGLSKTGFINEAGRCLVMQARLAARPVIIVLLDSIGKFTRLADAARIRAWLEPGYSMPAMHVRPAMIARVKASARAKLKHMVVTHHGAHRVRVQFKAPKLR